MTKGVESALLETEQFGQSGRAGKFVVEEDPDTLHRYTVIAGLPEGDHESLLEEWLTAVFLALPDAAVESADVVESYQWDDDPTWAARIIFTVD